jgi:hypothetical protein
MLRNLFSKKRMDVIPEPKRRESEGPLEQSSNFTSETNGIILNHSEIERRAYQIYLEKGGMALDNWLEAEQALINEHKQRNLQLMSSNPQGG